LKTSFTLYLILWAITAAYFIIQTSSNIYALATSLAFAVIALISFVVLLHQKSDEIYYSNLDWTKLILTGGAAAAMLAIASAFSQAVTGNAAAILNAKLLSVSANPTSIATNYLSEVLFTFAMVATAEELLKLAAYAELKNRYNIYIAIGIAVGTWAGYHAIQAYDSILFVIPAFINGVILIGLLEYTKSLLAAVFAHGVYNGVIITARYVTQPQTLPALPVDITVADIALILLAIVWVVFILLPVISAKKEK
jgi:hypothetical protein